MHPLVGIRNFYLAVCAATIAFGSPAVAQRLDKEKIEISGLLKAGWQMAAYASAGNGRNTFMLFQNSEHNYLVQCLAGYDVTRRPRTFVICYRLG
jgi:hypothetical protein